jgi:hypothetical protein
MEILFRDGDLLILRDGEVFTCICNTIKICTNVLVQNAARSKVQRNYKQLELSMVKDLER